MTLNVAEKKFLLKIIALWALLELFIRPLAVLVSRGIESIGCSTCISFKKVFVLSSFSLFWVTFLELGPLCCWVFLVHPLTLLFLIYCHNVWVLFT